MIRFTRWLTALAALIALTVPLAAQELDISFDRANPTLRILQDYLLPAGSSARVVVVIGGDATIDGHVAEDLVVILGKASLGGTAEVNGSVVVVGGTAAVSDGAKVGQDFVVIGGATTAPGFHPGGAHTVIGTEGFGDRLRGLVPWLTHGLLLGRLIVPALGWVWLVAGVFFFLNLILNALFDAPVRAATTTVQTTPFTALMAGLLVLVLIGPVCALLAISVIGIVVIPFVLCAMLAAAVLGRIAFARWLGMSLVAEHEPFDRAQSTRSFLVGSVVMCIAYVIPFIGLMVWILAGVFGLGAATLAFYASYRRENPRPPKKVVAPPPAPMPVPVAPFDPAIDPAIEAADSQPIEPSAAAVVAPPFASVTDLPSGAAAGTMPGALAYPKATFTERLGALVLDAIVIGIVAQLLDLDHADHTERLITLLALVYHVGFWTWRQTTLGGMICQLRVVRTDGKPLEFPESLIRGISGIVSLAVVGLGFLWILRDPDRQGWHDRVAGTYVVRVPRASSSLT